MSDCSANTSNILKQHQSGQDVVNEDEPEAQELYQESPFIYVPIRSKKNKARRGRQLCSYGQSDKGRLEDDRLLNHQGESDSCFPSAQNIIGAGSNAEFTYVERSARKSTNRHKARAYKLNANIKSPKSTSDMLKEKRGTIKNGLWLEPLSTWLEKSLNRSRAPSRILNVRCLALGPFTPDNMEHLGENGTSDKQAATIPSSMLRSSQYQLIFFLDVILPSLKAHNVAAQSVDETPSPSEPEGGQHDINLHVSFYDPAFRQSDKSYLRGLGHVVHDEEQDLLCDAPTFFYIPHGPLSLYAKLIQANHDYKHPGRLGNLLLFGNELTNYLDQSYRGKKDSALTSISKILEHQKITSIYPPKQLTTQGGPTVFNSMCLQWFGTSDAVKSESTETNI